MTRETKIGLLVGLMFIVVFAVLLSHTNPPSSTPGESLVAMPRPTAPDAPESVDRMFRPQYLPTYEVAPAEPGPGGAPAVSVDNGTGAMFDDVLPTPRALQSDGPDVWPEHTIRPENVPGNPLMPPETVAGEIITFNYDAHRVAPPIPGAVEPPLRNERSTLPEITPLPGRIETVPVAPRPGEGAVASAPPIDVKPPTAATSRPYIVQKGETLGEIATKIYGTASSKVVDFLVKANKDRIKNKDIVVAGQELVMPDLPADMFESIAATSRGVPPQVAEKVLGIGTPSAGGAHQAPSPSGTRQAPSDPGTIGVAPLPGTYARTADGPDHSQPAGTRKAPKPISAHAEVRSYQIKSKDTLSSIAREQLGSETLWGEIQKLNKSLDPKKLQLGATIRLPARQSLTESMASR